MKTETKIAAAILFLLEHGYTVSKGASASSAPAPDSLPDTSIGMAMSVEEFIRQYRIGRTIAYELIASGELRTYKVGRRRYISAESAAEWQAKKEGV